MGKIVTNLHLTLLLIFLSLLIYIFDIFKLLQLPKTVVYFITNPVSFSLFKTKQALSLQFHFVFAARNAAQENKALQEQMGQILSENANLRRKLSETETLLAQQSHLDSKTYEYIMARPIGLDRYLRIDKGSSDGVKVGQPAVFKDNLLGQVINVSEKSGNIRLLTDPDSKVAAFSFNKNGKAKGLLVGQFGTEILMDKVLHEEPIEVGDLVYSEGTEGYLPRGLILGKVSEVDNRENEIFKQAKVTQMFEVSDLELVFIIK